MTLRQVEWPAVLLWEVVKAKENLEAYIAGDYSVVPRVLCLRNQVDTPPPRRGVIY